MHRSKPVLLLLGCAMLVLSCIRAFEPEIESSDVAQYVVSGQVVIGDGLQVINVSKSSPISDPEYLPVVGCNVRILDQDGTVFQAMDQGNGNYQASIDPMFLLPGRAFSVTVATPEGEVIESSYDTLPPLTLLDTVYYVREDIEQNTPGTFKMGIQFYIDLHASDNDSRFFRWEAIETFQYKVRYPIIWYYDGVLHHIMPPDYSRNVCWTTQKIKQTFTLSTANLTENEFNGFKLHYVDNQTNRLLIGYSLLVKQYAISKAAFVYWNQLGLNSNQEGGLYARQPFPVRGNMKNTTHPDEEVLGFFNATAISEKRIFVYPIPDLILQYNTYCDSVPIRGPLNKIPSYLYPIYLQGDEYFYTHNSLDNECVDCLTLGGINIKPGFWPF